VETATFNGDELAEEFEMSVDGTPERATGELVQAFCARFGHGREAIPFVDDYTTEFSVGRFLELTSGRCG
jgi:hypothetical protein